MNTDIITMIEDEAMVSHKVIALNTNNKEVSIMNALNKYMSDFEEFGKIHFKNEAIKNSRNKVNETKEFFLNEQQATLLLTYLRNNEVVRAFKIQLVKIFYKMKEELYQKDIPNDQTPQIQDLQNVILEQNKLIASSSTDNEIKELRAKIKQQNQTIETLTERSYQYCLDIKQMVSSISKKYANDVNRLDMQASSNQQMLQLC